ncbi:MAG TPA: hypothetical protein ENK54_02990 [Thiotrichales bacterium]|nr:hypothetical protein [Thiotrichales bacterium]
MASGEFDLIERYFTPLSAEATLGIGDDCALLEADHPLLPVGHALCHEAVQGLDPAAAASRLVEGAVKRAKELGTTPLWTTLTLTLPSTDTDWLESFSTALHAALVHHRIGLVGGDTTRGPLAVALQLLCRPAEGIATP